MAVLSKEVLEGIKSAEVSTFEPVPAGDYLVQITGSEEKPTRDGTGKYISVAFDILGPKYQGRKLFTMFNIVNKRPEAQAIAFRELKSMVMASGMNPDKLTDTDQLIGLKCGVKVAIEESEQFGKQNRVKRYFKGNEVPAPAQSEPAPKDAPWLM